MHGRTCLNRTYFTRVRIATRNALYVVKERVSVDSHKESALALDTVYQLICNRYHPNVATATRGIGPRWGQPPLPLPAQAGSLPEDFYDVGRACVLTGLLALALTGCAGPLVAALEERQAASCIYWHSPFGHGVTSTGGVPLAQCLADPCRGR